jgi:archaemetzincin
VETISLIPVGHIDEDVLKPLADLLKNTFPNPCTIGPKMELPAEAFNVERSQFLASAILHDMKSHITSDSGKTLGVTDVDLYVPDLNFVFGLADRPGSVAIISMSRLRQEFYGLECDPDLFQNRMVKEAIHELGHSFGLTHCQNPQCVMSFSNSLIDTDNKGKDFCADCRRQLKLSE